MIYWISDNTNHFTLPQYAVQKPSISALLHGLQAMRNFHAIHLFAAWYTWNILCSQMVWYRQHIQWFLLTPHLCRVHCKHSTYLAFALIHVWIPWKIEREQVFPPDCCLRRRIEKNSQIDTPIDILFSFNFCLLSEAKMETCENDGVTSYAMHSFGFDEFIRVASFLELFTNKIARSVSGISLELVQFIWKSVVCKRACKKRKKISAVRNNLANLWLNPLNSKLADWEHGNRTEYFAIRHSTKEKRLLRTAWR